MRMTLALAVLLAATPLTAPTVLAQEVVWRMVMPSNPGQPLYDLTVERIAEPIHERSDGRMRVDMFSETAMGTGPEIVQNLRAGAVEMHWQAFAVTASYVPEFEFTSLPFIFSDREHFRRFVESPEGEKLLRSTEDYGIYILETNLIGYRVPVSSTKLFRTPEDFEGVRVRTMENNIQIQTMEALGANPVVLPYGEVYQSIQTGLIDGFYNDRNAFEYLSIHEVAPYLSEIPLFSLGLSLVVSKRAFDRLPEDLQAIVRETVAEAAPGILDVQWNYNIEEQEWKTALFQDHVSVEDVGLFVEKVAPMFEAFIAANPASAAAIEAVNATR